MKKNFFSLSLLIFSIIFQKSWSAQQAQLDIIPIPPQQVMALQYVRNKAMALAEQYRQQSNLLLQNTHAHLSALATNDIYFEHPLLHDVLHDYSFIRHFFTGIISAYNHNNDEILGHNRDFFTSIMALTSSRHLEPALQAPFMGSFVHHLHIVTLQAQANMQSVSEQILASVNQHFHRRKQVTMRHRALMPNIHNPEVQALTGAISAPAMPHALYHQ